MSPRVKRKHCLYSSWRCMHLSVNAVSWFFLSVVICLIQHYNNLDRLRSFSEVRALFMLYITFSWSISTILHFILDFQSSEFPSFGCMIVFTPWQDYVRVNFWKAHLVSASCTGSVSDPPNQNLRAFTDPYFSRKYWNQWIPKQTWISRQQRLLHYQTLQNCLDGFELERKIWSWS